MNVSKKDSLNHSPDKRLNDYSNQRKTKVALVSLTDRGFDTIQRIRAGLPETVIPEFYLHEKAFEVLGQDKSQRINQDQDSKTNLIIFSHISEIILSLWQESGVLIFVMATGIVVRQIAPLIQRKDCDPAVLVLDEEGTFVIPLLSGHLGGANAWALQISEQTGATPVITTATDVRGMVAPDEYARRYGWKVEPISHLPAVNRLLLEGKQLHVWSNYPLKSEHHAWLNDPHYCFLTEDKKNLANILVDAFPRLNINPDCLYLIPPVLSVGVGCRRGVDRDVILERITKAIEQLGASLKAISGIYSIDLKSDEVGLIEVAKYLRVPFQTFGADELQAVNVYEQLNRSNFVSEKIGVDGVCEAASILGARKGRLVLPKTKGQGVTVAISIENS